MEPHDPSGRLEIPTPSFVFQLQDSLQPLWDAWVNDQGAAESLSFAVPVAQLRATGFTDDALRWLVGQGLLEYVDSTRKKGREVERHSFGTSSSFFLSINGATFVHRLFIEHFLPLASRAEDPAAPASATVRNLFLPHWNAGERELSFLGILVKKFSQPAGCQELGLLAFEELRWVSEIDDPLHKVPGQTQKQRLHNMITNLNRHQLHRLLRFHGNGRGDGICWEPLLANIPVATRVRRR